MIRHDPIRVRQVRPGDALGIADFFRELSPATVYYRYFTASRASTEAACRLASCDHSPSEIIVAETDSGSIVGVLECYRHGDRCAELGVVVDDAFQSHGIGSRLMSAAVHLLEIESVIQLDGDTLAEHRRMCRWMGKLGARLRLANGTVHFGLPFDRDTRAGTWAA